MQNKSIPAYPAPMPTPPEHNTPDYQCNDELATLLTNLRAAQKTYFKSKFGTTEKADALINSKKLENELDAFLLLRKQQNADSQTKLF